MIRGVFCALQFQKHELYSQPDKTRVTNACVTCIKFNEG